ncbi:universal stress protein [Kitasatospora sp. NPDC101155]|uniref:universal stress protein n=1 Tax=Kitasatospora sp. NPDC101155 TaxID=3364097 RepID=UPI0038070304
MNSETDSEIVRYAAREAELRRAPVHLLHVVDPATPAPGQGGTGQVQEIAAAVLAPHAALIRTEFPQLDVMVEPVLGRPSAELTDRSGGYSLIVLGHRRRGRFPRPPLSSVARQVATRADCPVMVIRALPADEHGPVAVGFALPDGSRAALRFAACEAGLRGESLEIVHADHRPQPLTLGRAPPGQVDQSGIVRAGRRVLEGEAALPHPRHPGLRTAVRIEHGYPVPVLLDTTRHAALLVIGSHHRTPLPRVLLGSLTGEVLRRASCPVAVVPTAGTA